MIRRLIGENIDLLWEPSQNPKWVCLDPAQVDQVIANLCVNARDAIGKQTPGRIIVKTGDATFDENFHAQHPKLLPDDYVKLTVSDNGAGIDGEILAQIFEPFFTTKSISEGTGLGLSTVYGIVKQNNGFIDISSKPGQGSTFEIYLPVIRGQRTEKKPGELPTQPFEHGSETVLLMEDEPRVLKMIEKMLERLGYTVLTASTPAKALRQAEEHAGKIHLLLTDMVLPEMNGRELANKLRPLCPEVKHLFISGFSADGFTSSDTLSEDFHFLQKPFTMEALAAKIREVLDEV